MESGQQAGASADDSTPPADTTTTAPPAAGQTPKNPRRVAAGRANGYKRRPAARTGGLVARHGMHGPLQPAATALRVDGPE